MVDIASSVGGVVATLMKIGVVLGVAFMTALIVGFAGYFFVRWRKYHEFNCIIFEKDGYGNPVMLKDRGGVMVDRKTGNRLLFLQKFKVGMSPDQIPYVIGNRGKKHLFLARLGLKNFVFINPKFSSKGMELSAGDEDVNWALNDFDKQHKSLSPKTFWDKVMPILTIAVPSIFLLVMIIFILQKFDTLVLVADSMNQAAQSLAQAQSGTVVIN